MPTLNQIQNACNAAIAGEPPKNFKLSSDASQLATIVAEMWHFKLEVRELSQFNSAQKAAYARWSVST